MNTIKVPVKLGGQVAFWDHNGFAATAKVIELSDDGAYASLDCGGAAAQYVPRFGRRDGERRWCFDELEVEDFDPMLPPPAPRSNPVASIRAWCEAVTTPLRMAEALCMEEMAEVMDNFFVFSGDNRDENQRHFSAALLEYSRLLREYRELEVGSDDLEKLLDGHLDSAWVHLLAAAQIVGPENLAEAWSRLHRANIDGKQVDGAFILDETGKVTKPQGWTAPTYNDLIKKEIL